MSSSADKPGAPVVILVDDERDLLQIMAKILESRGYVAWTAESGQEALDVLARLTRVDLIIMDMNMPGMDGRELLRRLRERPQTCPVIAMGGLEEDRLRELAEEGVAQFMAKPFELKQFLQRVAEALGTVKS